MKDIIIVCPSLDPENVSGVSSVARFIISNNPSVNYSHFELGKKNEEKGGVFRVFRIVNNLKQWIKFLNKRRGSIIHYNFPITRKSALRDPLFMLIARLFLCKLIIHLHGGNYLENNKTSFWVSWILKRVFSLKCPIIVLSPNEKSILERKFNAKNVHTLPNCVDLTNSDDFERKINIDKPLTILYIGRIVETKGLNYMFDAFKILKDKGVPFSLIFAGEEERNSNFIERFRNLLDRQFIYKGIVLGKDKDELFKKADVFLLPSFYEGLPLSLLESMSFGLTPIVTNVGSINYCVTNEENGIIIKDHNSTDIVNAIEYLHNNRENLFIWGCKSKEKIKCLFDPKEYIYNLNKIYDTLFTNNID
ncbi:glycosyltransferase family 4 protein [Bacteroides sedimenti]|uniref:Polysaccharide biosynthesis protein n=1 Tax=Bacteroides sedimenti TaxID=2136147 RepID=A0ABM8I953_9BACE